MNTRFTRSQGCILFDLDGTSLDSAPDIVGAANELFTAYNKPSLSMEQLRPITGEGTIVFLEAGFGYKPAEAEYKKLRGELFEIYYNRNNVDSILFDGIEAILTSLNEQKLPWGIVTNKPEHLTTPLLDKFSILQTSGVLVCADTLAKAKPHPEPIWHACKILNRKPESSIYIGDHERDVIAGKAAGLFVVAALYGYIPDLELAKLWPADLFVDSVDEIAKFIERSI